MSLSFIHPWFLLGLLGIAVPIYLHLYFKKTPLKRDFPSLRLIKLSVEFVARKQKLRNILLLLLRIFVLLCLIIGLAHPFVGRGVNTGAGAGVPSAFVVLLDNSMSMGTSHQGISLFNSAKARALEILDQMGPGDKATVGFINDPGNLAFSQLTWDAEALKNSVSNVELSMSGTNLFSSLLSSLKLLVPLKSYRRSVYVITDMTENAWKPLIENYDLDKIDPGIQFILVPIGDTSVENMGIVDLKTDSQLVMKGRETILRTRIANHSARSRKTRVSLLIDGVKKVERPVEIGANSEKEVELKYTFTNTGVTKVRAMLPADSLIYDDDRFLSVKVLPPQKVLIIKPENNPGARTNNEEIFVRFALNPLNKRQGTDFLVDTRYASEIKGLNLNAFSLVCLINQRKLPENLVKALSEYLIGGGNLITFLGERVEPDWYNQSLIDNLGGSYLLPARIYKRVGNAVSKSIAYQMTDLDFGHPSFQIFQQDGNGDPGRAQVFEFFQVKPNPAAMILCRMSHGLPGIIEERRGLGKSMMVCFSADTSWTNWPVRPTFLPFLHQAVISMLTSNDLNIGSLRPGMPVSMNLRNDGIKQIKLIQPDKKSVDLPINNRGGGMIHFSTQQTKAKGFYKLELLGKRDRESGFCVNSPASESNLKRINIRKIPRFVSLTHKVGSRKSVKDKVNLLKNGRDYGRFLLWLLLILIMIETWFANIPVRKRV